MGCLKPDYSYLRPHPSLYDLISTLDYPTARRYLKNLWLTRGEQSEIIRRAKNHEGQLKESLPPYWFEKSVDEKEEML